MFLKPTLNKRRYVLFITEEEIINLKLDQNRQALALIVLADIECYSGRKLLSQTVTNCLTVWIVGLPWSNF